LETYVITTTYEFRGLLTPSGPSVAAVNCGTNNSGTPTGLGFSSGCHFIGGIIGRHSSSSAASRRFMKEFWRSCAVRFHGGIPPLDPIVKLKLRFILNDSLIVILKSPRLILTLSVRLMLAWKKMSMALYASSVRRMLTRISTSRSA